MQIYYAHSLKIYNTPQEEEELKLIAKISSDIVNPKRMKWTGSMEPYFEAVRESDMVVATEYNGYVGKGVFDEIRTAMEEGIPVYTFRQGRQFKVRSVQINNIYDWKVKYGRLEVYPY